MTVKIKGMEMPKNCYECRFSERNMWCVCMNAYSDYSYENERNPKCPLEEVK